MEFYISYSEASQLAQESELNLSDLDMRDGKYLVGAMMWGRPTSRKIDQKSILELTRCCFLDFMPKNTESKGLAIPYDEPKPVDARIKSGKYIKSK